MAMATTDYFVNRTTVEGRASSPSTRPTRITARVIAKLLAARFDKQLAAGATPTRGSAMAVHATRLRSVTERAQLAASLRSIVEGERSIAHIHQVGVHRARVGAASEVIEQVIGRLQGTESVQARGVAQLRVLMSNAAGPFYQYGSGELRVELRAALAAM
jgi:hypothetical protein